MVPSACNAIAFNCYGPGELLPQTWAGHATGFQWEAVAGMTRIAMRETSPSWPRGWEAWGPALDPLRLRMLRACRRAARFCCCLLPLGNSPAADLWRMIVPVKANHKGRYDDRNPGAEICPGPCFKMLRTGGPTSHHSKAAFQQAIRGAWPFRSASSKQICPGNSRLTGALPWHGI